MSDDFLEKAKVIFETKEGEPSLLDKAKEMFGEGATAAGEMMDKAKDFVEQGSAAAAEVVPSAVPLPVGCLPLEPVIITTARTASNATAATMPTISLLTEFFLDESSLS
jgi:hypothetical protein